MRILTIGVLIVTCGTLASLPFRRQQPVGDGDARAPQASGPARSALVSEHWPFVAPEPFSVPVSSAEPWSARQPLAVNGPRSGNVAMERHVRDASPPATYEDLIIPIEQSRVLRDRFSATFERDDSRSSFIWEPESKRQQGLELGLEPRELPSSALHVPQDEPPSVTSQASLRRLSSEDPIATPPPLPTPEPESESDLDRGTLRERHPKHWIRQPQ